MYGDDFYDTIRDGCRDSARAVTGYLAPHLEADTIVDVGCGEGWWGCTLADEFDAEVLGVDGPGVPDHAPIRARRFEQVDLRRRLDVGRFDLAVCLEVAEHLPPSRAGSFVADLCAAAPVVVFSAAIPGQGGTGHCFPSGTLVSGPAPRGSFTRWYEGPFVKLKFASGQFLTATPNHPVLTDRGWVALGELAEGHHVVRCLDGEGITLRVPDDYQRPSPIEDVARAVDVVGGSVAVPTAPEDFHGDGMGSEVHVVRTDGLLRDRLDAPFGQPLREPTLAVAGVGGSRLASQGPATDRLDRAGLALDSFDERIDYALACLWRTSGGGDPVDLRSAPHLNPGPGEQTTDLRPADPDGVSDGLRGLADLVSLDEVVHVDRFTAASHVYNLRTRPGWYAADGVIVHNCNEQWPGYWVDLFSSNGYHVTGDLRFEMWNDLRVENWYRQNLLICSVEPIDTLTYGPVLPVVHPVLYDARRR